ncbi:hypothetical protein BpHYR1_015944 [Brachionus plicatilis]|uniref:Uncharacterized protein n=1 Tax=Brachionus plicatilis TaxID=10195 RepID=A0A3M7QFA8_BRAPC|nr:hypothetical protein BpHYR1_015944 [Brachionus plicatilis]
MIYTLSFMLGYSEARPLIILFVSIGLVDSITIISIFSPLKLHACAKNGHPGLLKPRAWRHPGPPKPLPYGHPRGPKSEPKTDDSFKGCAFECIEQDIKNITNKLKNLI